MSNKMKIEIYVKHIEVELMYYKAERENLNVLAAECRGMQFQSKLDFYLMQKLETVEALIVNLEYLYSLFLTEQCKEMGREFGNG